MNLSEFIQTLKNRPETGPAVTHYRYLPAVEASFGDDPDLRKEIAHILPVLGIHRLYSHQVEALQKIRQGKHVLVSTPTASGKSLIYNLAVMERLLLKENARALYLFPLKALEQDQLKGILGLAGPLKERKISVKVYDGDTPPSQRKQIRARVPDILITNPDMLHSAILAYHQGWESFFKDLAFVVFDEVHTYRGIFGSHMHQIVRRLKRICHGYGASPQFILLSATVHNAKEFGETLTGEEVEVVHDSGSPKSGRHFLFLNPDAGPNFSAAKLFLNCIEAGFRTIAFTQSRKITELIHLWTTQLSPALRKKVSSYRAGFLPEERREIERRLARGDLLGVVSTSALEMGIDIGYLDICLLVGYPGTMITTWQRGGRVGRSGRDSLIILVAKPDALDQYFVKHPEAFFERPFESAILDPHNPYVVEAHLPCAAAEIPLTQEDSRYWPKDLLKHLEKLENEGALRRSAEGSPTWYSGRQQPHSTVNIRSGGESFTIFEKETGEAIGTIDGIRALKECHPGAIYLHRARSYQVHQLDLQKRDIVVQASDLRYFTRARTEKETEILEIYRSRPKGQFLVREGRVKVTERITGYEKRSLPGQELMGVYPLELPPQIFETVGLWVEIEDLISSCVTRLGLHFMGGIHAIEHGAIGIFPLFALCDRNDIGGICYTYHPQVGKSAIFIYDGYPGGVGLAQHGFEVILEWLEKTHDHLEQCGCEDGCPSCIHSPKCGSGNKPLDKRAAVLILKYLLGRIPLSQCEAASGEEEPPLPAEEENGAIPSQAKGPRIVFMDLETQRSAQEVGGWKKSHLMGISVAVVFDSAEDRFFSFTENEVEDLLGRLAMADLVVGFNIRQFDYAVLGAYTDKDLRVLPTFDILEDVHRRLGFRLGLDHLASETLECRKSAEGLQALEWFKKGEMDKLTDYCRQDVAITRDLFEYGLQKGHLLYRDKKSNQKLILRLDWNLEEMLIRGGTGK